MMSNNYSANYDGRYAEPETFMSFNEYENMREQLNERRKQRIGKDRERRAVYYRQQRIMGVAIMLVGIACLIIGCVITASILEYFGIFVGLVGLYTIFTRQMVLVNKYYLERQDKYNEY